MANSSIVTTTLASFPRLVVTSTPPKLAIKLEPFFQATKLVFVSFVALQVLLPLFLLRRLISSFLLRLLRPVILPIS